jgi:1,4-alpha-glucan branching enzyme
MQLARLKDDMALGPYMPRLKERKQRLAALKKKLAPRGKLASFACGHEYYGLHHLKEGGWCFRELAPNATAMWLVGDFSNWERWDTYEVKRINEEGVWELFLPEEAIKHGQHYQLHLAWNGGEGQRLPSYVRRVVQDSATNIFSAQVWAPEQQYIWKNPKFKIAFKTPLIYESHVGMAQEEPRVGTYNEFREHTLPRIAKAGYNTVQLMAIMEHPYYGSFGYQVANFFACSSRFGTPEELKQLIDEAHGMGIAVIMDIIHSHSVRNENDGLARFDGTDYLYFHGGERGHHPVWDSSCFDYGRLSTLHLLLSNCRYWLDEFHFDGFRFDGVTSMLYLHHGLGVDFLSYEQYFDNQVDEDAYTYLALANQVIHEVRPDAITIAEDVSGMPGLGAPQKDGGAGFDYRLAMGITEAWGKLAREVKDEDWYIPWLWHELTNRRADEKTISYVECHDQALVGGKTLFFEMAGPAIYDSMHNRSGNLAVERAVALHKLARLATLATSGNGYLNFMGNEFGHPEWIDFPREGNGFSYQHARRLWSVRDNTSLQFSALGDFDEAMLKLFNENSEALTEYPRQLYASGEEKLLAFSRGELFFIFNFHPTQSYTDWKLMVPPGDYKLMLTTDSVRFGGHERVSLPQTYFTMPSIWGKEQVLHISLYVPSRCALVLKRND